MSPGWMGFPETGFGWDTTISPGRRRRVPRNCFAGADTRSARASGRATAGTALRCFWRIGRGANRRSPGLLLDDPLFEQPGPHSVTLLVELEDHTRARQNRERSEERRVGKESRA